MTTPDERPQDRGPAQAPPGAGTDATAVAGIRVLLGVIVAMLLIAGMREAQTFVIPFLVALFATMIAAPVVLWLESHSVPTGLAVLVVVAALGGIGTVVGLVLLSSIDAFTAHAPSYGAQLNAKIAAILPTDSMGLLPSWRELMGQVDPGQAMGLAGAVLGSIRGVMTYTFLIILLMVFMLLDLSGTLDRIRTVSGESQGPINYIGKVAAGLKRYFMIKSVLSLLTGVAAGLLVYLMGVDFALLWAMFAFLFNFIPNVGSIIAAIPPIALAFIQFGPGGAFGVAAGYVAINVVIGNLIEPRVTGRGLGLSTLTVFLSLLFWGWVLGPVGLLLSVPLTLSIKLALEANEGTRWMAVLMGSSDVMPIAPG